MTITYCECALVALGIQHAMRMCCIFICGPPRSTLLFPRYLINGTIFKKNIYIYWTQNVCFDFLYSLCFSEAFLILRRNERQMIKIYIGLQVKYPLLLSDFNEISILSTDFRKIYKYQI